MYTTGFTHYRLAFGAEMRLGVDYGIPFPDPPSSYEHFAADLARDLEYS